MLSASEWARRLNSAGKRDASRLSIIPMPKLSELERRGETSIDLRLGRWFRAFRQTRTKAIDLSHDSQIHEAELTKEYFVPFGGEFLLHPRSFVLGITLEWLRLPADLSGYVTGKSSLGRRGLIIETASGIHPGFAGCLALELSNVGEVPLGLHPGMKICQIFLHNVASETGAQTQFVGHRKPVLGQIGHDVIVDKLSQPNNRR